MISTHPQDSLEAGGRDRSNHGASASVAGDGAASADASPKHRAAPRARGAKQQAAALQQTFAAQLSEALGPGITADDAAAAIRACSITRLDQWPVQVLADNTASLWELTNCSSRAGRARAVRTAPELLTLPKDEQREVLLEFGRFFEGDVDGSLLRAAFRNPREALVHPSALQLRAAGQVFRRNPRAVLVHPSALQARFEAAMRALALALATHGTGGLAESTNSIKYMLKQTPGLLRLPEGVLEQRMEAMQQVDMPFIFDSASWMQRMMLKTPQLLLIEPRALFAKFLLMQDGLGKDFFVHELDETIGCLASYSPTRLSRYLFLKRATRLPSAGRRRKRRISASEKGLAAEGVEAAGEGAARDGAASSWCRDDARSGGDSESDNSEGEGQGLADVANDELPQIGSAMWV
ncbi:hypothetical protein MNEG_11515 [Monoraphidium neglectum]|uniref:Uncharacterized protein n=1 Tax=Monoraphidium neglectum TaxID=145388 RepID=A0A0D2MP08_9CHLO|nr:hypothetical protein MNEG_11515 [Monoraphidium neglectum]KIY96445.1 hypothetical protein MNEG_11515 [Monoraphidium neglectum]|eukprot:XP_013895465.1 hypothetical protein MNEG_11515 [Monoraphidium neglectum]